MDTIDLRDLIKGIITIIIISLFIGQYGHLREVAKKEFIHAMKDQHTVRRGDIEVLR